MNRRQFIVSCAAAASAATMPGCALRPRCDRLFWYNASSGLHIPCEGLERPLRVWQVSDSHLNLRDSRDDEYKDFYARMGGEWNPGLTAREAFERILEKAKGERPDLLLVTGDLISFPTLKNVEFAVERLDACGVPWLYTAGNHDWHFEGDSGSDAEQRERWIEKRLLPLYKGEDPMAYAKTIGGVKFLMIDNSTYNVDERQLEFFRRDENKPDIAVAAHSVDERMHRASEFQIAAKADCQSVKSALFAFDCQQVGHRLRRVAVTAVAGVDHRNRRVVGRNERRSLFRVAHGNDIGVAAHSLCRIGHAFTLCNGRGVAAGNGQHIAAEFIHRGFKAQPCARGRFKKERCQFLVRTGMLILFGIVDDILRHFEQLIEFFHGKIENIDDRSHTFPPIQLSSDGLLRNAIRRAMSSFAI